MSQLVCEFHLPYAWGKGEKGFQRCIIQGVAGVKDAGGIELDPLRTMTGTASENGYLR